jgi:hypothetical protein
MDRSQEGNAQLTPGGAPDVDPQLAGRCRSDVTVRPAAACIAPLAVACMAYDSLPYRVVALRTLTRAGSLPCPGISILNFVVRTGVA